MSAQTREDRGEPVDGAAVSRPVVIKVTEHGPLRVKRPATVVDADGRRTWTSKDQ